MIDSIAASIDFRIIAPEIALVLASFIILVTSYLKAWNRYAPHVAGAGLMMSLIFSIGQLNNPQSGFFGMVTLDDFSATFKIIFVASSAVILLLSQRFLAAKGINRPEFYALLCISTMGMMVMATTTDLVVIFLGLEIMSVPLYVMAGMAKHSLESNEAGIKYLIMGSFASAFLLMGIAFVFGASGTTDLRRIAADLTYIASNYRLYLYSGAALVLIGFAFKVAAVPFHTWVPDVYQGAPTPVTAFFSVGPKAALRTWWNCRPFSGRWPY
jgi:NADH-quinone oxidoreductase subunit N